MKNFKWKSPQHPLRQYFMMPISLVNCIKKNPYQLFLQVKLIFILSFFIIFIMNCKNPDNVLIVDRGVGGIAIGGHVYSSKDSLPLDSARIVLTGFQGTNLQRFSKSDSVVFYSDSVGWFSSGACAGYSIKNGDTIDLIHQVIFKCRKAGFKDTNFQINNSQNLNVYLKSISE